MTFKEHLNPEEKPKNRFCCEKCWCAIAECECLERTLITTKTKANLIKILISNEI